MRHENTENDNKLIFYKSIEEALIDHNIRPDLEGDESLDHDIEIVRNSHNSSYNQMMRNKSRVIPSISKRPQLLKT